VILLHLLPVFRPFPSRWRSLGSREIVLGLLACCDWRSLSHTLRIVLLAYTDFQPRPRRPGQVRSFSFWAWGAGRESLRRLAGHGPDLPCCGVLVAGAGIAPHPPLMQGTKAMDGPVWLLSALAVGPPLLATGETWLPLARGRPWQPCRINSERQASLPARGRRLTIWRFPRPALTLVAGQSKLTSPPALGGGATDSAAFFCSPWQQRHRLRK